MSSTNQSSSNIPLAIIAYLTIIGVLIAFFMNKEQQKPLVSFHVRQSLGLWLLYFIIGYMVSGFDNWMLTYAFWICFSALFIYGILGAVNKKENRIPFLGDLFQTVFKSL